MHKRNLSKYIWLRWVGTLLKIQPFDSLDLIQAAANSSVIIERKLKEIKCVN